jgi:hypothetical protein
MLRAILNGLTLEDWKWKAEQFNKIGDQIKRAGLQLGYRNLEFEFRKIGESTGYDDFLRFTDSELVALELDCGWMTVAGLDPVLLKQQHSLLDRKNEGYSSRSTRRNELSGVAAVAIISVSKVLIRSEIFIMFPLMKMGARHRCAIWNEFYNARPAVGTSAAR